MVRSLYSGVAGLTTHQTRMDVIGNNIANVNTYGFKASSVTFRDIYYQTAISPTGGAAYTYAGNNPSAVGYGVQLGSIDKDMSLSSFQSTNRVLDLAIDGDGFFIIGNMTTELTSGADPSINIGLTYTRMGRFYIDNDGNLVAAQNNFVLGSRNKGAIDDDDDERFADAGDYAYLLLNGNDSKAAMRTVAPPGSAKEMTSNTDYILNINDLIRRAYYYDLLYQYGDDGTGNVGYYEEDTSTTPPTKTPVTSNNTDITWADGDDTFGGKADDIVEKLKAFSFSDLEAFDIGADGVITVMYAGQLKAIARIELATFDNPEGLKEAGMTSYLESASSGEASIRRPGDSGTGNVVANKLEMSNVNLAKEFSDMIVTQRGFQANARIITVSDSMIEELVNLKR